VGEDVVTEGGAVSRLCVAFNARLFVVLTNLCSRQVGQALDCESQVFSRFHARVAAPCDHVSEKVDGVPGHGIEPAAGAACSPRSNSRRGPGSWIHGSDSRLSDVLVQGEWHMRPRWCGSYADGHRSTSGRRGGRIHLSVYTRLRPIDVRRAHYSSLLGSSLSQCPAAGLICCRGLMVYLERLLEQIHADAKTDRGLLS
jgi:hypothetical protein